MLKETENLNIRRPVLVTLLHCHILHCLPSAIVTLTTLFTNSKFANNSPIIACLSNAIILMINLNPTNLHAGTVQLPSDLPLEGSQNFAALPPRHVQLVPQLEGQKIILSHKIDAAI